MHCVCVLYRKLELSSVSETTEGEGLSLHHPHLICGATPHPLGPSSLPSFSVCLSSPPSLPPLLCSPPLSLQSLSLTFDTTGHTAPIFKCLSSSGQTSDTHIPCCAWPELPPSPFLHCLNRGIHQLAISLLARHTLQPAKGTSEAYYSTGTLVRALGWALMIFSCKADKW